MCKNSEAAKILVLEEELNNLKEQFTSQSGMFEMTTVYLDKLCEELKRSEKKQSEANKIITDSINYARRIQDAFVVDEMSLRKILPQSFIFQQAKDIVSGDFVWSYKNESNVYVAAGDCTGHGVPGAMLSIFMISMLNQIVSNSCNEPPSGILKRLDILLQKYINQYNHEISDSAEISLIKLNLNTKKLEYSGAKRPLVRIRNNKITIFKGRRFILGNFERRTEDIIDQEIDVEKGDVIYTFSDGFVDQFGGEKNKKYTTKRLLDSLQNISNTPIALQGSKLSSIYNEWIGEYDQIDDVLVLGIRI
jgi:serine phosphatase RsbU (regulator of sigma subunit)